MADYNYDEYGNITNYIENPEKETPVSTVPQQKAPEKKESKMVSIKLSSLIITSLLAGIIGGAIILGGYLVIRNFTSLSTSYVPVATTVSKLTAEPVSNEPTAVPELDINKSTDDDDDDTESESDESGTYVISPATSVAKKVLPSVVGIRVTVTSTSSRYGQTASISDGTGVILTEDGYIVTNYHVISDMLTNAGEINSAATLAVYLSSESTEAIDGTVIGYDSDSDLAVIKIDRTGLTAIEVGDSDKIEVGDIAIAIGNPGGLEYMGSVSQGIISGLNRTIVMESSYENLKLIQTDAAINPGNSGGALVDASGRLIGINSVKIADEDYEGMGFAIPVNDVIRICTEIVNNGMSRTPYIGITFSDTYTSTYLKSRGYPEGLLVESVAEGSPADQAGIEVEDILVSFNGTTVTTTDELIEAKKSVQSGDTVTVTVYRLKLVSQGFFQRYTGEYCDIEITLG